MYKNPDNKSERLAEEAHTNVGQRTHTNVDQRTHTVVDQRTIATSEVGLELVAGTAAVSVTLAGPLNGAGGTVGGTGPAGEVVSRCHVAPITEVTLASTRGVAVSAVTRTG